MKKFTEKIIELKSETGASEAYIVEPDKSRTLPLLIAIHGNGREALSYRDIPFYARQRDLALECGYLFAAISNGSDAFGAKKGYENIEKLYSYIRKNYDISSKIALWSSSAGGLLMHRFFRNYPSEVGLLLGTFPVSDPFGIMNKQSLYKAFEVENDNEKELIEKVTPLSPFSHSFDIYKDAKIVYCHGIDDAAVPISQSRMLYKKITEAGGDMSLVEATGGHSTNNFAIYDTPGYYNALKTFNEHG